VEPVAPLVDDPEGHEMQAVWPDIAWYESAAQMVQDAAVALLEKYPAGQEVGIESVALGQYLPAPHGVAVESAGPGQ
jgi:hypothetical protein